MKKPSKTIAQSLIATSLLVSSTSAATADILPISTPSGAQESSRVAVSIPSDVMASISSGTDALRQALMSGAKATEQLKIVHKLSEDLKKKNLALKFKNAVLEAKEVTNKKEKQSLWQRVTNWFSSIDATKVATSIISGILTIAGTLLIILL